MTYCSNSGTVNFELVSVFFFERTALNPFPNKPCFLHVCFISLLKTLWEKEKLLVTSNFSFSHSVFYLFGALSVIFIEVIIVVCKRFQLWKSLKFVVWERVNQYIDELKKEGLCKHCWKRRNAGNKHFLLFPQCFLPSHKLFPIFNRHLYCRLQML